MDVVVAQVFQVTCLVCGGESDGKPLCFFCAMVSVVEPPHCVQCGVTVVAPMRVCAVCIRRPRPSITAVRSAFWLEDPQRVLLHHVKFGGKARWLDLILDRVEFPPPPEAAIVPVPLGKKRRRQRGFNQAELIARRFGKPAPGLVRVADTPAQATLSKAARARNLRGAFVWKGAAPVRALVVDDVYTTGETLRACARALRKAGTREVYGWTLLRTPIRRRGSS